MKRKIVLVFLAALLAAFTTKVISQDTTVSTAPSPSTISSTVLDESSCYGLKIGMSEQEIHKLYPRFEFTDRGPIRRSSEQLFFKDASVDIYFEKNQNAIIDLTLIRDHLVNISVRWLPASFEIMQSKLERAYGNPLFVEKNNFTTSGGEKFTNAVATWTGNKVTLVHYPHYENIAQSRLLFMDKPEQKK